MKAAVFLGAHQLEVRDVPIPQPQGGQVRIKVMSCGVCGTDVHIYEGAKGAAPCVPPTVLGHEFAGVVDAVGPGVTTLRPGDRVCVDPNDTCGACGPCQEGQAHFCRHMTGIGTTTDGGFAQYVCVREKQAYPIPDHLSFDEAAMAEPVACCLHGLDLTEIKPGNTCVLVGGGPIGLLMLSLVRAAGASTIAVVEPVAEKRELALALGATQAYTPQEAEAALAGQHIHHVIECVGRVETMQMAIRLVGKGGTVMLFGLTGPDDQMAIKPFDLFQREITLRASFINPYTQARALRMLASGQVKAKEIIAHAVPLEGLEEVLKDPHTRRRGKVVVHPWQV